MKKAVASRVAAVVLCLVSLPAVAVDGVAIEGGRTHSGHTEIGRVAAQWDWHKQWFQGDQGHLGGYWDLALGHWHGDTIPGQNADITEIGLTPVFRFQNNDLQGMYLEVGVGFHWLTRTRIRGRELSSQFQFGDHAGMGYRFGARHAWDVSYRYQHLSNGGIKKPNDGMDFHQVRLQYHF